MSRKLEVKKSFTGSLKLIQIDRSMWRRSSITSKPLLMKNLERHIASHNLNPKLLRNSKTQLLKTETLKTIDQLLIL